ncbi:hypothetical protein DPMN_194328 [Dreissena polymorpha]|uniref:Uncharacterized protein n=1 Tax=Dreissena polymorpha TaxID=45954 RepID=A0A9D3Y4J4_DREPO|nr:hypothetical protein DPMN_194328 [Dreissena polymorpha]
MKQMVFSAISNCQYSFPVHAQRFRPYTFPLWLIVPAFIKNVQPFGQALLRGTLEAPQGGVLVVVGFRPVSLLTCHLAP